jgi:putative FmdB family regulatory protein
MPLYEFRCNACGVEFEVLVRGNAVQSCPACESADVKRKVSLFAVSSDAIREANLGGARQTAARTAKDKSIAEQEVAARHSHDH